MSAGIKLTALAALLLASTGTNTSCDSGSSDSSKSKACNTRIYRPKMDMQAGVPNIVAKAESTCDAPPVSHKVHLTLSKKDDAGNWVVQTGGDHPQAEPWGTCEEIPPAGKWIPCEWRLYKCEDGLWRTKATVVYTNSDGQLRTFALPEKGDTRIKCPKG